ncbi:MAG: DNA primase [Bacteroidales bacterium]|jgi:DNA primase
MIDRATVDKILDSVRIEEVIGDFISLKRRGANYLGLCPFHQDKNPSMSVSPARGIFKCFSCGKAGTALSFVMDHEHLSYPEALRYLAKKYGVEIVEKDETPEEIANRLKYESLLVVSDYAQKFFENILWNSDQGRAIGLTYFRERKFSDETIKKFGLGYAYRPISLAKDALENGYKKEFIVDAGLCIERENGELSDRFFDRVMFPIHTLSGRIIAFGGRTLKTDKSISKYINSPETEIYSKSRSLYGIFFAKSSISKIDKCYLVEGYTDVISMHQAGIENVVASSGTALTSEQIRLIKRFTNKITILYDGDEAGIKASLRGIDLILEEGMQVRVVLLPPEEDPDSFAKSHSKDEILDYIAGAEKDFIGYKSELLAKDATNDPLKKAQLINEVILTISVIPDPIVRSVYVEMVADRFEQKPEIIFQKINEFRAKKRKWGDSGRSFSGNDRQSLNSVDDYSQYGEKQNISYTRELKPELVIPNSCLTVSERELIYYLLKFGQYTLNFEKDMVYGAHKNDKIVTSEFIYSSLMEDDLELENPVFKAIFDEYFTLDLKGMEEEEAQKKVIRHFTTHENPSISSEALNIICESHSITIKEYKKAIVPEQHILGITVPKSLLLYKFRITERACEELLVKAQKEEDYEIQKGIRRQLQLLAQVKNGFAKELNRF